MSELLSPPLGELILYTNENGTDHVEFRLVSGNLWLTQAAMAELFQTTPQNITQHLKAIYAQSELDAAATCKDYLQDWRRKAR